MNMAISPRDTFNKKIMINVMINMDLAKTAVICLYENRPTNYLSRVIKTGEWLQRQTLSILRCPNGLD